MLNNNFVLDQRIISEYMKPLSPLPTSLKPKGKPEKKIRSILFDVYGTLFISGSGDISIAQKNSENINPKETKSKKIQKLENLLQKYRILKTPSALLKDFFSAIENKHQELKKNGTDFPEVEIDRIWMDVLQINDRDTVKRFAVEYELIVNPVYPMPHLDDLLTGCREKKILMGIISNAQFFTPYLFKWFLGLKLEELGFSPDLLFFSYRFGYAKPSLFLYQDAVKTLNNMGIRTDSVLYVGNDMLNDIYPAQKAGFQTALFAGDARSLRLRADNPKCMNISPDLLITDLIQLLDYI